MAVDVAAVYEAFAALARALKRVSVYRHARDQHASYLEPAHVAMRSLLEVSPSVTVMVEPNALLFGGEVVHTEPARDTGFCFRLHRDGVRSLTFRRGIVLDELITLAFVGMSDPQHDGGREDAVTELWKADLKHVHYSAGAGYRMDEAAGGDMNVPVSEIAVRVQEALRAHADERAVDEEQPLLWTEELRGKRDASDYPALARRAAMTILRIVEQDCAGWDQEALEEAFWRICDQLVERGQAAILARALEKLRTLDGLHAGEMRQAVARWLCEPTRIQKVVAMAGTERPALLRPWLALLPPEAGPLLVQVIGAGKDAAARHHLAAGALARLDTCLPELRELLISGGISEVEAVLSAMGPLPPEQRAELAEAAFENADVAIQLEAVPLIAADPSASLRALGPALTARSRELRLAAVRALGGCGEVAEQASALLLAVMSRPRFARLDKDERTDFYRALGRLGSPTGFSFLFDRLARPPRKLFGKRKAIDEQLLAVQGLAEDGSPRSLRALEDALLPSRKYSPSVVAACRAAAQHLRERRGGWSA